jgi:serine/threonine-protein kinase
MNKAFWKSDWFVGASISLVFFVAWWSGSAVLESLERDAYDLGVRVSARDPDEVVKVVAIDDKSIQNLGRWPWSRKVHGEMIDRLRAAGAKTIGMTVFYSEPEIAPGLDWIGKFRSEAEKLAAEGVAVDGLLGKFSEAETALDTDRMLAHAMTAAGNVVLGMQFIPGEPIGNPDEELPGYVTRNAIPDDNVADPSNAAPFPRDTVLAEPPIPAIGGAARSIGHLVSTLDVDGGIRFEPLILNHFGQLYPSQSLMIAAAYHNLTPCNSPDISTKSS